MLWQSDVPLVSTTCCSIENLNQLSNIMSDSKSKFKNTGRGEAVFVTEIITGLYSCYIGEGNGNPLVLLPGKLHGWRSLVGYSPWGRKESDTTERLHFLSIVPFGERNGNLFQCSCLENPMDRGAWWATVYGVAKRCTQLSN